MMKTLQVVAMAVSMLAVGGVALAKGGSPQTHHCKMPDGNMDMAKTKAQCKAAKGKWTKDAPAAEKPADKPADAPPPAAEKK